MEPDFDELLARSRPQITWKWLTGSAMTESELHAVLASFSVEDCILTIGKTSKQLGDLTPDDISLDLQFAEHLGPARDEAVRLIRNPAVRGRLLSPAVLTTLARESILHAHRRPADDFSGGAAFPAFVRALCAISDLYDPDVDDQAMETEVARTVLRRVMPNPLPRNMLPRYWRLLVELASVTSADGAGFDFDARAQRIMGMSVERHMAIGFAAWSRFMLANAPEEWVLTSGFMDTDSCNVSSEDFATFLESVSRTTEQMADAYRGELKKGRQGIDHHQPLWTHPLVEFREGLYVPIDVPALGVRLLGDGLFWRLRPREGEPDASAFGAAVGAALEEHCWQIARSVYLTPPGGVERLFRQFKFGKGLHGPDSAIFDGDAAAFVEVGAERVHLVETVMDGNLDAFDREVEEVLMHRVKQLDDKIDAYRSGVLRFAGHPNDPHLPIFPAVCFVSEWPLGPFLRARIDQAIRNHGYLRQPNVARCSILAAEDFEVACAVVESGSSTFTGLLRSHRASKHADYLLREYIREVAHGLPITELLSECYDDVTSALAVNLGYSPPPRQTKTAGAAA